MTAVESGAEGDRAGGETFDVVVVGAGGAGLAAAAAATEAGASVLVLEKLDDPRGTTAQSVGSFMAAATRLQARAGIHDTVEAFADDVVAAHPGAAEARDILAVYARRSAETLHWLERLGVVFVGPFIEHPHRVARLHNAVPNGSAYIEALGRAAVKAGAQLRFGCEVVEIRRTEGRVDVLSCRHRGLQRTVRARRGVVLASGDFTAAPELLKRHLPAPAAAARPINPHSTGDGQRMAMELGADMRGMGIAFGPQLRFGAGGRTGWIGRMPRWRWLRRLSAMVMEHAPRRVLSPVLRSLLLAHMSPDAGLFAAGARLVDMAGTAMGGDRPDVDRLALSPGAEGYVILDAAIARRFARPPHHVSTAPGIAFAYFEDYRKGRPDLLRSAATLDGLAAELGCDGARLKASVAHLDNPPFHALGPVYASLTTTEGGAAIDTRCRVLDREGVVIEGLYAAGSAGQGGLILKGHGGHIGWAITSGRLAGLECAAAAPSLDDGPPDGP